MANVFFTSDTHFDHSDILDYCKRPFNTVTEMNEAFIERWNNVVTKKDTVYHLGDVILSTDVKKLYRLNGKKILIIGNHDEYLMRFRSFRKIFIEHYSYHELKMFKKSVVLCHYPFHIWKNATKNIHLHGHTHGKCAKKFNRFDVGIDTTKDRYKPYTFEDVEFLLEKQNSFLTQNGHPYKS